MHTTTISGSTAAGAGTSAAALRSPAHMTVVSTTNRQIAIA